MTQRTRSPKKPISSEERFHRFLRPGALARLRDARMSTASRSLLLLAARNTRISLPPSDGATAPSISPVIDGSPFFAGCRIRGPRCPQRKKLHAARAMILVPGSPVIQEPVHDDIPALDQLNSDLLLAH